MARKALATALALLLMASTTLATNGVRLIGFGTKMNGRGGTGIGVFDSPSLMMTNPAGLVFDEGTSFGVNFAVLAPLTHFKNTLNDEYGDRNYFLLGGLGYVRHSACCPKFTWGLGVFTQGGMGVDYALNHALFRNADGSYDKQIYHSMFSILQAGPSFAYNITPKFSVGTSLHLMYAMMELEMPYSLPPSIMKGVINPGNGYTFGNMFADPNGLNYSEVTSAAKMSDLGTLGFAGKLGFAWKVSDRLSLGLNYTSPTKMTFKNGTANLDMTAQFHDAYVKEVGMYMAAHPGVTPDSAQHAVGMQFAQLGIDASQGMIAQYDLEAELTNPQSLGLGVGWKASEKVNLAADVEWINWKNAFDKMKLTLKGGENPNINRLLGNTGDFKVDFPLKWKDAVMVRLGGEYLLNPKTTLRLGYAFGSNPVPTSTLFSVFPAIVEHHITMGASYDVTARFSAHFAYEMALTKTLTADNPSLIANEYNDSEDQLSGMFFNIGVAWKL